MPSLPVVTHAVRRAIKRTRDTSDTGDDSIGPAFLKHAVLGGAAHTPDHVLAPLLGRRFRAVLCSGHVPAAWKVARLTPLFKKVSEHAVYKVVSKAKCVFEGAACCFLAVAANKPSLFCATLHSVISARVVQQVAMEGFQ
jgi:hypothetical protein